MNPGREKVVYLKNYAPPAYLVEKISLRIELHEKHTHVFSVLTCRRNPESGQHDAPLILDGEHLRLISVKLGDQVLEKDRYVLIGDTLQIDNLPESTFEVSLETVIDPSRNTELEGLYLSSGNYCTQCEAEGFRRITYFPDRPDVMSVFTTTIIADKQKCPVLLSNGNLIQRGDLADGFHFATWHDPFPKPCYLFALVAGDLVDIADTFETMSGRNIDLRIYVEKRNIEKCDHAMASLKKSMKWEEEVFGREYDLDTYMIVAVDDFNMGAMENKGLNVFNSKYVLAKPETATDTDYDGIEGVIGHEYFHNWTGNRITCRDWFQLSLKEGLTVFRDQEFSSDMGSRGVKRVNDVRVIRNFQFREDSGPMAHPVRPESYMEINNFYTLTVYNKGAEVVRMIHTLIGPQMFRQGMDLYFERHDGQAVTCDDFVDAMADASGFDLTRFKHWYSQSGTPEIQVETEYDATSGQFVLELSQSCPPTPGQPEKKEFLIPVAVGLLDRSGKDMALRLVGEDSWKTVTTKVLQLDGKKRRFVFEGVPETPVLSLLRGFSAPVKVVREVSDEQLSFLMAHDSDSFNRWDAAQQLGMKFLLEQIGRFRQGMEPSLSDVYVAAFENLLHDRTMDPAFKALILDLPAENWIGQQMEIVDPAAIYGVRSFFIRELGSRLKDGFLALYREQSADGEYVYSAGEAGRRSLRNICLDYLLQGETARGDGWYLRELGLGQYHNDSSMTDVFAALKSVVNADRAEGDKLLADFFEKWKDDPLIVDKWLSLQAACVLPGTLERVRDLTRHPSFSIKNPNKVRALVATFCSFNQAQFHALDGAGYVFLVDRVQELNSLNPQIAARMLSPLTMWRRYDAKRQELMRHQLERVRKIADLSPDVEEIVTKSLAQ